MHINGIAVPEPSELTQPFWDACRNGELRVQQCDECGHRFFTPLHACPKCLSGNWHWALSGGAGTLYSFTVVHRPAHRERPVPYIIAIVDLDDGWTMMTNIVDADPDGIRCGQRVAVRFQPLTEQIYLPVFAPADIGPPS